MEYISVIKGDNQKIDENSDLNCQLIYFDDSNKKMVEVNEYSKKLIKTYMLAKKFKNNSNNIQAYEKIINILNNQEYDVHENKMELMYYILYMGNECPIKREKIINLEILIDEIFKKNIPFNESFRIQYKASLLKNFYSYYEAKKSEKKLFQKLLKENIQTYFYIFDTDEFTEIYEILGKNLYELTDEYIKEEIEFMEYAKLLRFYPETDIYKCIFDKNIKCKLIIDMIKNEECMTQNLTYIFRHIISKLKSCDIKYIYETINVFKDNKLAGKFIIDSFIKNKDDFLIDFIQKNLKQFDLTVDEYEKTYEILLLKNELDLESEFYINFVENFKRMNMNENGAIIKAIKKFMKTLDKKYKTKFIYDLNIYSMLTDDEMQDILNPVKFLNKIIEYTGCIQFNPLMIEQLNYNISYIIDYYKIKTEIVMKAFKRNNFKPKRIAAILAKTNINFNYLITP